MSIKNCPQCGDIVPSLVGLVTPTGTSLVCSSCKFKYESKQKVSKTSEFCTICGKVFPENEIEPVFLVKNTKNAEDTIEFNACHSCALSEKLDWYTSKWITLSHDYEALKAELNSFRLLMLSTETISILGDNDISIMSFLKQNQAGIEALPLDKLLKYLQLQRQAAEFTASIINKKVSRDEINAHIKAQRDASNAAIAKKAEEKKIEKTGLKGDYTKDEAKALKSLMKNPAFKGMSEEDVYNKVLKPTILPKN